MKQIKIGTYPMFGEWVDIYGRDGLGGEFYMTPEHGQIGRIKIGLDDAKWENLLHTVLHELMEYAMCRRDLSFHSCGGTSNSADRLFVMDHQQFDRCCVATAECLTPLLPDLKRAYDRWGRKPRRKR